VTTVYPQVRLRPGRDFTLRAGHPWVFSGALSEVPAGLAAGSVVDVLDASGDFVARGHLHPRNSLAFRALTRNPDELIDVAFYRSRIARAAALRALLPASVTGYRLIHSEADGLPGIVVDRYDRWLVAQITTAGAERERPLLIEALTEQTHAEGILFRDDPKVREREGLSVGKPVVPYGEVPSEVEIREGNFCMLVDPWAGQKTGFFLDQRDKRAQVAALAPHLKSLLNAFSYTGGFALAALGANAALHTVNCDSSTPALALARRNYELNGHDPAAHEFVEEDVTRYLQHCVDTHQRFDLVVLDPPAFAKTLAARERALRGYEHLNSLGARVIAPGGLLLTCSCSGGVSSEDFETVVRQGLVRAGRAGQIVASFGPSLDHPTLPGFSEDRYLKALVLRLD
jgi:23S rRNA (cytosine1962-C5)-methyltransferase